MIKILFILSLLFILYTYVGYPLLLYFASFYCHKTVKKNPDYEPYVSLIIAVHNEQSRIFEKIQNTFNLDYPKEKLEIIFASDASTDSTDDIISSYDSFKLVRSIERKGKEYAQMLAIQQAHGEIFVFSDVATILEPSGIQNIVSHFADTRIGCVSSEDRFIDDDGCISGEGIYVRYEMFLRRLESCIYSIVGMSGSFFAVRREACQPWAVDLPSDFNTLLNSVKLGLRGVTDPKSLGFYRNITDEREEFNRKVRTVVRGLNVLKRNISLLNPYRYGIFSWLFISHKLCRWIVPYLLIMMFVSNLMIFKYSLVFKAFLYGQVLVYLLGSLWYIHIKMTNIDTLSKNNHSILIRISKIIYYFLEVNIAIMMAWNKLLKGENKTYWKPSER